MTNQVNSDQFMQHVRGLSQNDKFPKSQLIINTALGLAGEAGEVCDLIKKNAFHDKPYKREDLLKEFGDVLWYLYAIIDHTGFTVEEVMIANIEKLRARHGGTTFNAELAKINTMESEDFLTEDESMYLLDEEATALEKETAAKIAVLEGMHRKLMYWNSTKKLSANLLLNGEE
jgi:NTP pyrophosphatase (non-canonical NTP hydrolase)